MVAEVLGDPELEAEWRAECKAMADRIIAMRQALKSGLEDAGSTKDWSHVTSQIGSAHAASLQALKSTSCLPQHLSLLNDSCPQGRS